MKKTIIASLLLITTTAFSQVAQAPVQKNLTLTLSVEDTQTILDALKSKPYESVAGLIQNIVRQAETQLKDTIGKKK
jgi:DNA-binding GntR family transcriptional regulator